MKYTKALLILCISILTSACNTSASLTPVSATDKLPLAVNQPITIEIDGGMATITNGESGFVEVARSILTGNQGEYSAVSDANGVRIVAKTGKGSLWKPAKTPPNLHISAPVSAVVKLDSFEGAIELHDFSGEVAVTTVTGNIQVEKSSGKLIFKSNRGNVSVQDSQGEIHLLGNYGLLSLKSCSGNLEASTIMGTVRFSGRVGKTDQIHLETDHGPVEMRVAIDSDMTAKIRTTSGVVDCVIPGLVMQGNGCGGVLGSGGGGILNVRTVSGNVSLQRIP